MSAENRRPGEAATAAPQLSGAPAGPQAGAGVTPNGDPGIVPKEGRGWNLKPGDIDPAFNVEVAYLIFESDDCVVYLDTSLDTYWKLDERKETTPQFGLVLNRVAQLEAIPLGGLSHEVALAFRTMVAEGVARALDDNDNTSANKVHDQAEAYARARLTELARSWYLKAGLVAFAISAIVMAVAWFLPWQWAQFVVFVGAGAIGASFSLISRLGSFPLDPSAGKGLYWLETTARVCAGVVGAFVAVLAVRANLLPSFSANIAAQLMVCFVAGSSERFVPNLVERIQGSSDKRLTPTGDTPSGPAIKEPSATPPGTQPQANPAKG